MSRLTTGSGSYLASNEPDLKFWFIILIALWKPFKISVSGWALSKLVMLQNPAKINVCISSTDINWGSNQWFKVPAMFNLNLHWFMSTRWYWIKVVNMLWKSYKLVFTALHIATDKSFIKIRKYLLMNISYGYQKRIFTAVLYFYERL